MLAPEVVAAAVDLAEVEISKFGLPTQVHFDLSLAKGQEIARALGADSALVKVGTVLMDLKLGEAFSKGKLAEHVKMSVDASADFLTGYEVRGDVRDRILNCVAAHHGTVPFTCLEAEIVANADCYRFMHPTGVFHYIGTLTKRNLSLREVVEGAQAKLLEKRAVLSLPACKAELEPIGEQFLALFAQVLSK